MSIDWITVIAQIANFLVLVWLLKRFLYRPILDGIDARETEITNRMQEAVKAKEHAEEVEAQYHEKEQALNLEQSDMAETIRKKAEEQRDALLAETHQRIEQEHVIWQDHLDDEARKYTAKLHRAGARALMSLTRKALIDLADETLETRMAHQLVRKIEPITKDLRNAAGHAAQATVSSHETLSASAQSDLTKQLKSVFPEVDVAFKKDDEQAPGLVLRVGGAEMAWTVDSYISGLDALVEEQLAAGHDKMALSS